MLIGDYYTVCQKVSPIVYNPKVIAHRGANDRFNESTLTAYKIAAADGADFLEIDLRMTEDGELVAMHDQAIDRTTNGSGDIAELTLNELRAFETIDVYDEVTFTEEVPTLAELLKTFSDNEHYYIETRLVNGQVAMEQKTIQLLNEYDLLEKELVTLQSFSKESLEKIKSIAPDIPLTFLFGKGKFDLKEACKSDYPNIGIESTDVTLQVVRILHEQGKEVHVYFTNKGTEKREQRRIHQFKVDGYFTDDIRFTQNMLAEEDF